MPLRLAMWSGPRNISTAMMRSFGARSDTYVTDEPFYAHYLQETGLRHPMREEVLAAQPTDAAEVAAWLSGPVPQARPVWYQKHMTHHLLPDHDRGWMRRGFEHVFLVREPRAMLASLLAKLGSATRDDTGLPQQIELFEWLADATGRVPVVVDAGAVLRDPAAVLGELCSRVGLAFDPAMLSWEAGPRATDGVWAPHWYGAVLASTGFAPYTPSASDIPAAYESLTAELEELYWRLAEHALGTAAATEGAAGRFPSPGDAR